MTGHADPPLIHVSSRLYRLVLGAYPAAFRRAYGREMASLFRDCCREHYRQRGLVGLLPLWGRALTDLATNLPKEYAMTIVATEPPPPLRRLCSSCSSEVMEEWTTCAICGSPLNAGTTREGHLPQGKKGFRAFAEEVDRVKWWEIP
jgi:hypothetical protein